MVWLWWFDLVLTTKWSKFSELSGRRDPIWIEWLGFIQIRVVIVKLILFNIIKYNNLMTTLSNFWTTCRLKSITKEPTGNWSGHIGKSTTTACHFPGFYSLRGLILSGLCRRDEPKKIFTKMYFPIITNFIRWIFTVL